MSSANVGYLEFQRKNGRTPVKYPLEIGSTTIGTNVSYDIRIKSKSNGPKPVSCILDTNHDGVAILENKCDQPILYNGKRMKKVQMLKNNDEFEIQGKRFRYINPNMNVIYKNFNRQSVAPNLKIKPSKIPVSSKKTNTRLSLSVKKKKLDTGRRSCASALPDRKRNRINQWQTSNSSHVIAGRSFIPTSAQKPDNLAKLVRKSLFLKNKGDISFNNSIVFENRKIDSFILNVDGSISRTDVSVGPEAVKRTPSPRGVKRALDRYTNGSPKNNKKRRYNEKVSFNLSISGTSELFDQSESSNTSKEQDSSVEQISPIKTRNSRTPKTGSFIEIQDTPLQNSSLKSRTSTRSAKMSASNSFISTDSEKNPKIGDLLNFGSPFEVFNTAELRRSTPRVQDLLNFTSPVELVSPLKSTPKVGNSRKTPRSSVKKSSLKSTDQDFMSFNSPIETRKSTPKAQKTPTFNTKIKTPRSSVKKSSTKSNISGVVGEAASVGQDFTSFSFPVESQKTPTFSTSRRSGKTPRSSVKKPDASGVLASFNSPVGPVSPMKSKRSTPIAQKTPSLSTSRLSRKTPRSSVKKSNTKSDTSGVETDGQNSTFELVSPVKSRRSTLKVHQTPTFNTSIVSGKTPRSSAKKSAANSTISGGEETFATQEEFIDYDSPVELVSPVNTRRSTPKVEYNTSISRKTPRSSVKKSATKLSISGIVGEETSATQEELINYDSSVELVSPVKTRNSTPKAQFNTSMSRKTPRSSVKKSGRSSIIGTVGKETSATQEEWMDYDSSVDLISPVKSRKSTPKVQKTPTLNISKSRKTPRSSVKKSAKSSISGVIGEETSATQEELINYDSFVEPVSPVKTRGSTPKVQKTPTFNINKSRKTPRSSLKKSARSSISGVAGERSSATQVELMDYNSPVELVSPRRSTPKAQCNSSVTRKTPRSSVKKSVSKSSISGVVGEETSATQEELMNYDSLVEPVSPVKTRNSTPKAQSNTSMSRKTPRSSVKKFGSGTVGKETSATQEEWMDYDSSVELVSPVKSRKSTPKVQKTPTFNISKSRKTPRSSLKKSARSSISGVAGEQSSATQVELIDYNSPVELVSSPVKTRRSTPKAQCNTSISRKTPRSSVKKSASKSSISGVVDEETSATQEELMNDDSFIELVSPVKTRGSTPKVQKTPTFNINKSRRSSLKKSARSSIRGAGGKETSATQEELMDYDSSVDLVSPVKTRGSTPKVQKTPTFNINKSRKTSRSSLKKSARSSISGAGGKETSATQEEWMDYDSSVELVSPVKTRRSTPGSSIKKSSLSGVAGEETSASPVKSRKSTPANSSRFSKSPKLGSWTVTPARSSRKESFNNSTYVSGGDYSFGIESLDSSSADETPKNSSVNSIISLKSKESLVFDSSIKSISPVKTRKSSSSTPAIITNTKTSKVFKSPRNDLTDVIGVKKLLKTPRIAKSPRNDLTEVKGVKKLMKTPIVRKSPRNDLTDIKGVKKLLRTPKVAKTPKNDLTDIRGVKKLLKTPKLAKSPKNDLTDVRGVKKLMKTPKVAKSPKNDLSDVRGIKKLWETPNEQKSPLNDLTDVRGVKRLMRTPKLQKSPENDLTNIKGVKKLLKTPKVQKSPTNNLLDISGIDRLMKSPQLPKTRRIFRTPKSPLNDLTDVTNVQNDLEGVGQPSTTPEIQKVPRRGRTKKAQEIISTPEIEIQKVPRRGRSKKDQEIISTPEVEIKKISKRGRPKKVEEIISTPEVEDQEEISIPEVPTRILPRRGRPKKNQDEILTPEITFESVPQKRGRGRKVQQPITSTPAEEAEVTDTRIVRSRAKTDESDETNLKIPEGDVSERKGRTMRVRKVEKIEEKTTRGKKRKSDVMEDIEEQPVKRSARGRGKKDEVVNEVGENNKVEDVEEQPKKRNVRGRKKVVEEVPVIEEKSAIVEEVIEETKPTRSRKKVEEVPAVEEKSTRSRKKVVDDDTVEEKKTTRERKKVVVDEDTSEKVTRNKRKNETVEETQPTRNTRRKKEVGPVDDTSTKEDKVEESTNNTRGRRGRAAKITDDNAPVERRRRK